MNNNEFLQLASKILLEIFERYDSLNMVDIDFDGNMINMEIDDVTYIINKHEPTQQIWVSSPKAGAIHFNWDLNTQSWTGTKGEGEIIKFLDQDIGYTNED